VTPSPPILNIVNPATDGQPFQLGLPVTFVVEQVNGVVIPPCSSFSWDAFNSAGASIFTGQTGCAVRVDNIGLGTGKATASLTQFGLTGSATRTATIVDDGKMHVMIINPLRSEQVGTQTAPSLGITIPSDMSQIFQATVVNSVGGVSYQWSVSKPGGTPQVIPGSGGGNTIFLPPFGPTCLDVPLEIQVVATDANSNQAREPIPFPVKILRSCLVP
jgi:hypothetical protein